MPHKIMPRPKKSESVKLETADKPRKASRRTKKAILPAVFGYLTPFFARYGRVLFLLLLFVFVVLAGVLVFRNTKSLLFAGSVNGEYISKNDLSNRVISSYGRDEFDAMVNEKLVEQEAKKKNIKVGAADRQKKITEYETAVGGKDALKSRLSSQGVTDADFNKRVDLEVMIEKMFADKSNYTQDELQKFWDENKGQLETGEATMSATPTQNAKQQLTRKKISDAFSQWLTDNRKNAKIDYYLTP